MISARFFPLLAIAVSSLSLVTSQPASILDVFAPKILSPNANSKWIVGQSQKVTWETNNAPVNITNQKGRIYLVHNNRILFNESLAEGFNITDGQVEVTVPSVPSGKYQIDLFGDSGDWSDYFSIQK